MGSAVFSHWTASVLSKRALRRTVRTAAWARNDRYRSASSFYVMLEIYSRYVVGWMIAQRERASLADAFIRRGARRRHVCPKQESDRVALVTRRCVEYS